ncbi:hypothetical protein ANCCAN_14033 [Ancylostoma caninum]|uniref:SCP domain-containing protein n=1 Tax=Ancylostoma caninum TaxID=29170 RepID=A0A368G6H6_ANCCA|nr:hypothetical protein ANCCAN_14033 [Ancylostoma caninum]
MFSLLLLALLFPMTIQEPCHMDSEFYVPLNDDIKSSLTAALPGNLIYDCKLENAANLAADEGEGEVRKKFPHLTFIKMEFKKTGSLYDRPSTSFVNEAAGSWSQKLKAIKKSKFGCILQYWLEEVEAEDNYHFLCLFA